MSKEDWTEDKFNNVKEKEGKMEDNIMELWEKVLDLLKEEISPIAFNTFISEIVPRQIDSKTISLLAKSSYHVDVCKVKYEDLIKTALKMLTSIDYEIIF